MLCMGTTYVRTKLYVVHVHAASSLHILLLIFAGFITLEAVYSV